MGMNIYTNNSYQTKVYFKMKIFNTWPIDDIKINDPSLINYIFYHKDFGLIQPHTSGSYDKHPFKKIYCPLLERFVCSFMLGGRNSGKKLQAIRILEKAFHLLYLSTGLNPLQILIGAIINATPIEDYLVLGSKGRKTIESVDVSPYRRISQAMYLISTGVRKAAFKTCKGISECLCDELLNAYKNSQNSYAIRKKTEIEKIAITNR